MGRLAVALAEVFLLLLVAAPASASAHGALADRYAHAVPGIALVTGSAAPLALLACGLTILIFSLAYMRRHATSPAAASERP